MSVKINLPGKEDVREIAGEIAAQTAAMKAYFAAAQSGLTFVQTWAEFKHLCQLGTIKKYFAVGDQLKCQKGGKDLLWDIVHIGDNEDGSNYVILQTHYCLPDYMAYSPSEAIFYASQDVPAGTYHYTMTGGGDKNTGWGKTWQITTISTIPKGGQLRFTDNKIVMSTNLTGKTVATFSGPTATSAIETITPTEGTEGTDLTDVGSVNNYQRVCFGYNRWSQNDLRQWLNSDAAEGSWFSAQNGFQKSPNYASKAGFLNDLDADFKAVITKSKLITALNSQSDNGGYETTYDYFFLPSAKNLNARDDSGDEDANTVIWDYYTKFRQDGKVGVSTDKDPNRIKTTPNGSATLWWGRSTSSSSAWGGLQVQDSGACYFAYQASRYDGGVAPACRIN